MEEHTAQPYEPTPDELAWDQEFKDEAPASGSSNIGSDLASLAVFALRLPGALVSSIVPDETVQHSRAAARETFLALRSLLGAVGDRVEDMLADPAPKTPGTTPVQGPAGTWGTGRSSESGLSLRPTSSPKVKRINVSDEPEPPVVQGDMP